MMSMLLRKRPVVTPKMVAANQANARLSTGPRTEEGKKRVRVNGLRYAQRARSFREAIAALGGDPADFDRIIREEFLDLNTKRSQANRAIGIRRLAANWEMRKRNPFFDRPKPECNLECVT